MNKEMAHIRAMKHLLEFCQEEGFQEKKDTLPGFNPDLGFCLYLQNLLGYSSPYSRDGYKLFFTTWPDWTGSLVFPVPSGSEKLTPKERYYQKNLWEGEQLDYRISLMKHVLCKMEERHEAYEISFR